MWCRTKSCLSHASRSRAEMTDMAWGCENNVRMAIVVVESEQVDQVECRARWERDAACCRVSLAPSREAFSTLATVMWPAAAAAGISILPTAASPPSPSPSPLFQGDKRTSYVLTRSTRWQASWILPQTNIHPALHPSLEWQVVPITPHLIAVLTIH